MKKWTESLVFFLDWLWLYRFTDKFFPRPGVGGPSPRLHNVSEAEWRRIQQIQELALRNN
jgi:hypothetical protein